MRASMRNWPDGAQARDLKGVIPASRASRDAARRHHPARVRAHRSAPAANRRSRLVEGKEHTRKFLSREGEQSDPLLTGFSYAIPNQRARVGEAHDPRRSRRVTPRSEFAAAARSWCNEGCSSSDDEGRLSMDNWRGAAQRTGTVHHRAAPSSPWSKSSRATPTPAGAAQVAPRRRRHGAGMANALLIAHMLRRSSWGCPGPRAGRRRRRADAFAEPITLRRPPSNQFIARRPAWQARLTDEPTNNLGLQTPGYQTLPRTAATWRSDMLERTSRGASREDHGQAGSVAALYLTLSQVATQCGTQASAGIGSTRASPQENAWRAPVTLPPCSGTRESAPTTSARDRARPRSTLPEQARMVYRRAVYARPRMMRNARRVAGRNSTTTRRPARRMVSVTILRGWLEEARRTLAARPQWRSGAHRARRLLQRCAGRMRTLRPPRGRRRAQER